MNSPENNIITVQTHKEITRLYKHFLEIIEDIRNQCPDCLPQERYEHIRKRVLDNGNESARQLLAFLDYFDFTINKNKVEEAANQRRVVKKVAISSALIEKT
jgi:hypothetical protein